MMKTAETLKRINELEKLASAVLKQKRSARRKRPIVIEFSGSPKSGKTSAINSLDIFLRRNGFRTRVLTERASVCPIPNKFDPIFNVWTGCAALNQLMDTISNNSTKLDVIIMDRGFFDAICWFEWQRASGYLRETDFTSFADFFLSSRFRMSIDLVLAFTSSPETSISREYSNLLTRKEGSVMRKDVLSSYRTSIEIAADKYKNFFRDIVQFNTDSKDQNTVSYEITRLTLEKLSNISTEKTAYIESSKLSFIEKKIFRYKEIEQSVIENLGFSEREGLENSLTRVQFVPIAVIRDRENDTLFVARKSKKSTTIGSPEKDKTLGYFGGHVREEDSTFLKSSAFLDILKQCVYREVKEEIGIDIDPQDENPYCIWLKDGTKSEQHLAVVFIVSRDLSNTSLTVDGDELVRYEKKGGTGTGEIQSFDDILNKMKTDTWTPIIIKNIIGYNSQDLRLNV